MTVDEFKALQKSLMATANAVTVDTVQRSIKGVQNVLIDTPDLSNIDEDSKTLRDVFELLNYQFPITLMRYSLSEFMRDCNPSDTTPKETLQILALRCLNRKIDNPTYDDFYNGLMGIETEVEEEPEIITGAASVIGMQMETQQDEQENQSSGVAQSAVFTNTTQQQQVQQPQVHLTAEQKIQKFANDVLSIAIAEPKGVAVYNALANTRYIKPYAYNSIDAWARSAYTSFDKQFVLDFGRAVEGLTYFTDDFYLEDTYVRVLKAKSFLYNAFFALKLNAADIKHIYNLVDKQDILDAEIFLLKLVLPSMCYTLDKEQFAQNRVRDTSVTINAPDGMSFKVAYKELGLYIPNLIEYSKQALPVVSVGATFDIFFVDQLMYNKMIVNYGFMS